LRIIVRQLAAELTGLSNPLWDLIRVRSRSKIIARTSSVLIAKVGRFLTIGSRTLLVACRRISLFSAVYDRLDPNPGKLGRFFVRCVMCWRESRRSLSSGLHVDQQLH